MAIPVLQPVNMGAQQINNAADPTSAQDVATKNYADTTFATKVGLQNSTYDYAADTGATNAYAVALTPAVTSYVTGLEIAFKATNANTGASTLNVNSLGTKSIVKNGAVALAGGEIAAGQIVVVVYDGTNFQMVTVGGGFNGVNNQTGTSYAVAASDNAKLVTLSNSNPVAVTIAQAGTGGFGSTWAAAFENRGAGVVTITPTTSTIDGAGTLSLLQGQGCWLFSDGSNYFTTRGMQSPNSAPSALTLIAEQTPSGTGTVTFSSIPSAYRDLMIVVRGRGDAAATFEEVRIQFNSDTGANYDHEDIILNNATNNSAGGAASTSHLAGWLPAATSPANSSGAAEATVFDYTNTSFHKSVLSKGGVKTAAGAANLFAIRSSGWWANTAAINAITVFLAAGNFLAGSVVSLYGVGGAASGSNTIFVTAGPPDAPPAAPTAMDDEFSGTTLDAKWTINNGVNAPTVTVGNGWAEILYSPASTTLALATITQTAPATPWEVTAKLRCTPKYELQNSTAVTTFFYFGLTVGDGTKYVSFELSPNEQGTNATSSIFITKWNTATSFNSNYALTPANFYFRYAGGDVYMRIKDDGVNLIFSISRDGLLFQQVFSIARLNFLASVSKVGIMAGTNNDNTLSTITHCDWFRRTDGGYVPVAVGTTAQATLSFDSRPLSANGANDEFEALSLNTSWTVIKNNVASVDFSQSIPGSVFVKFSGNQGYTLGKSFVPGSADFSCTIKGDMIPATNFDTVSIQLGDTNADLINTPGTANGHSLTWGFNGQIQIQGNKWVTGTRTVGSAVNPSLTGGRGKIYLHIQRVSGTWTMWYSFDGGAVWTQYTGLSFGTPTVSFAVVAQERYGGTPATRSAVDFVRFNQIFL